MYRCEECGTSYSWAHFRDCQIAREWSDLQAGFFFGGLEYLRTGDDTLLRQAGAEHRKLVPSAYEFELEPL